MGNRGDRPNPQFAECFNSQTKLCICIFAFVSGWAIALGKLTFRQSFERIKKLIGSYWCIAIPAILLAVFVCGFELSALDICKELCGLGSSVMIFAWYVPFYAFSLIMMTIIQKWLDGDIKVVLLVGVVLPICIFTAMKKSRRQKKFRPCLIICAIGSRVFRSAMFKRKNHWFDKIRSVIGNYNCFLISGILIIFCFVGRYFISALDFVYCALLVFAIFNLQINLKSFLRRFLCIYVGK